MEPPAFERFRSMFRGEPVLPSDEGYEAARLVWTRRSTTIQRDVVRAVEFAREHECSLRCAALTPPASAPATAPSSSTSRGCAGSGSTS
jgi:hypothetical protein